MPIKGGIIEKGENCPLAISINLIVFDGMEWPFNLAQMQKESCGHSN
jgi:hypothetical protein